MPNDLDFKIKSIDTSTATIDTTKTKTDMEAAIATEIANAKSSLDALDLTIDKEKQQFLRQLEDLFDRFYVDENVTKIWDKTELYYMHDKATPNSLWSTGIDVLNNNPNASNEILTDLIVISNTWLTNQIDKATDVWDAVHELHDEMESLQENMNGTKDKYLAVFQKIRTDANFTPESNDTTLEWFKTRVHDARDQLIKDLDITVTPATPAVPASWSTPAVPAKPMSIVLNKPIEPLTIDAVRELLLKSDNMLRELEARKELNAVYGPAAAYPSGDPDNSWTFSDLLSHRDALLNDPRSKNDNDEYHGDTITELKRIAALIQQKERVIDTLWSKIASYLPGEVNINTIRTRGNDKNSRDYISNFWFGASVDSSGTSSSISVVDSSWANVAVWSIDALNNALPGISVWFRNQLITAYNTPWWTFDLSYFGNQHIPLATRQLEHKYAIAYHELHNNHMMWVQHQSEASFLKEVTKLDRNYANDSMGSKKDFKRRAKQIKKYAKEEGKKAEYVRKAFPHMIALAQARAVTSWGLDFYDQLLQSLPWAAHNHAVASPMWGINVWDHPDYQMSSIAAEIFGAGREGILANEVLQFGAGWQPAYSTYMPGIMLVPHGAPSGISEQPDPCGYGWWLDGTISRGNDGLYTVEWSMKWDILINTYLASYQVDKNHEDITGETVSMTYQQAGYNLIRKSMLPGNSSFSIKNALMAKWISEEESLTIMQSMLWDALKYDSSLVSHIRSDYEDQLGQFRVRKAKKMWKTNLPAAQKKELLATMIANGDKELYDLMSMAAVTWLQAWFGLPCSSHDMGRKRLAELYGTTWLDISKASVLSNTVVWQNMVRMLNEATGQNALEPRSMMDRVRPVTKLMDEIKSWWLFGVTWDAISQWFMAAGVDPVTAKKLWKAVETVWPRAVWLFAWYKAFKRVFSHGKWFGTGLWRAGVMWAWLYAFGWDAKMLLTWWEWGVLAWLWQNYSGPWKEKARAGALWDLEMFNIIFGDEKVSNLWKMIEQVPGESGNFRIKSEYMNQMATMLWLDPSQKSVLDAITWWSSGAVNAMITSIMVQLGIDTQAELNTWVATNGSKEVRGLINNLSLTNTVTDRIIQALWDDNVARADVVAALSTMSDAEKKEAINRIWAIWTFSSHYNGTKSMWEDHLLKHRKDTVAAWEASGLLPAWFGAALATGFDASNDPAIVTLKKDYILWAATGKTMDDFELSMAKLFDPSIVAGSAALWDFKKYAIDPTAEASIKALNGWPENKALIDMSTTPPDTGWLLNSSTGSGRPTSTEMMTNLWANKFCIPGIENTTTTIPWATDTKAYFTMRIPNATWWHDTWRIKSIDNKDAYIKSAWYHKIWTTTTISPDFEFNMRDTTAWAYTTTQSYSEKIMDVMYDAAVAGQEEFAVGAWARTWLPGTWGTWPTTPAIAGYKVKMEKVS